MGDTPTVWIDRGCIRCNWCQQMVPQVFSDAPNGCVVKGEARTDGTTDDNREVRARLQPGAVDADTIGFLTFVADGCPAKVIRLEPPG